MRERLVYLPAFLGILTVALSIPLAALKLSQPAPVNVVRTQAAVETTTLSFFPQRSTYSLKSKEFSVGIIFESNNKEIATAAFTVKFDPTLVSVSTVTPGILFDKYGQFNIDNNLGKVTLSGSNVSMKAVNGIFASLKLKPKKEGLIQMEFENALGVEKTVGAVYTITK
jgi:hypothetical protein